MAVVLTKMFSVTVGPHPLAQSDLDVHTTAVNVFLATLVAANVLDVKGMFAPGGKGDLRSTYITTIVYLG